jgi:hypothetical protein
MDHIACKHFLLSLESAAGLAVGMLEQLPLEKTFKPSSIKAILIPAERGQTAAAHPAAELRGIQNSKVGATHIPLIKANRK